VLLVLDATTGQNAVAQAENFKKVVQCTGIILAKLDGTAKAGRLCDQAAARVAGEVRRHW
jgi:fused signal recognition particle receptor